MKNKMTNTILLKQYADTGAILPKYQLDKLGGSLQKTYLRRRVLQSLESTTKYSLRQYELGLYRELDEEGAVKYIIKKSGDDTENMNVMEKDVYYHYRGGWRLRRWVEQLQQKDRNYHLHNHDYLDISYDTFKQLDPEVKKFSSQRGKLVRLLKEAGYPSDKVENYFKKIFNLEVHTDILKFEWEMVSEELFEKYFHEFIIRLDTVWLPERLRDGLLWRMVVDKGMGVPLSWRYMWSINETNAVYAWLIENDILRITKQNLEAMHFDHVNRYVEKSIERDAQGLRTNMSELVFFLPTYYQKKWMNR
jgi:hypothetical protein